MEIKNASLPILLCWSALGQAFALGEKSWPDPLPLGKEYQVFKPSSEPMDEERYPLKSSPEGEVTLPLAFSLALLHNPELAVFAWEIRASEAVQWQARLRRNPEISLSLEDFGGSGQYGGSRGMQTTVEINQTLEFGGKRTARLKSVAKSLAKAGSEYETKRLEILKRVSQAYTEAVAAQRGLALAEAGVRLADQMAETVAMRVNTGKVSAVETIRARMAAANARIELAWAKHRLEEAREGLVALWGDVEPRFQSAQDDMDSLCALPAFDSLLVDLRGNPELVRIGSEMEQEWAVLELEKTQAIPNVTLSGGYRRHGGPEENALVAGISLPLPLMNRNQGRVLESKRKIFQSRKKKEAIQIKLRGRLAEAHDVAATARTEIALLKNTVMSGAESAFQDLTEGYQQGRYSYLEVLDAQKSLIGSRQQYLRALTDFHHAIAEIESLIGRPLKSTPTLLERN